MATYPSNIRILAHTGPTWGRPTGHPIPTTRLLLKPLADLITDTQLKHLGDPLTPTYTPTNTPLDHWLMRIPTEAQQPPPTITTAIPTEFSDHKALLAEKPQIGDLAPHPPHGGHVPHHARPPPPFILPIPKPLIDLYQLGNDATRTAQEETLLTIQQLTDSE